MENSIKHTYHIGGMSCGGCVATVKNKLTAAPGVTSVQIDLAKKQAEITSSAAIKASTLQDALKNTRYTIAEFSAA
jgi:copper chaperone CopZ